MSGGAAGARRPRVAVLIGAVMPGAGPDEQDTLAQAAAVAAALQQLGFEPVTVPLSLDLTDAERRLKAINPRFVFNLVDTVRGQGRLVHLAPALLDALSLPYTGSATEAVFATSDKPLAKRLLRAAGIATPDWLDGRSGPPAGDPAPGPWIVKSVWEHASVGLDASAVVRRPQALAATLADRRSRFGGDWFAERFVDGREFNLAVLAGADGPRVLPAAEIHFVDFGDERPRIVDYAAKWLPDSFEYRNTPRSFEVGAEDRALIGRLQTHALACWRLFGLKGYARVDFRVDGTGEAWVLEVNANPCIAPDSGFIAAAAQAGLSQADVVAAIAADLVGGDAVEALAAPRAPVVPAARMTRRRAGRRS